MERRKSKVLSFILGELGIVLTLLFLGIHVQAAPPEEKEEIKVTLNAAVSDKALTVHAESENGIKSIFINGYEFKNTGNTYDDAYDLLARVFVYGVGRLIRSGFHRSYVEQASELSTLRGKILVQESINEMSMVRNRLKCSYDEYTSNDIFNQIIKYTMELILSNPEISSITKKEVKKHLIFFTDIDSKPPTKENRSRLIFNRNNMIYKLLISIAVMIYEGTSVNEEEGFNTFKDFFREEQMQKVFEMFILNFYAAHLDRNTYKVHAPKINWHIKEDVDDTWGELFDVEKDPGDRRTDIVVENKIEKIQMIFDAKYYKKTFIKAYMGDTEEKIRTAHLNQVRGYILDSDFEGKKLGALLYPMVNDDLKKGKVIAGEDAEIIIKTINLNDDWTNIEEDMLDFVKRIEKTVKNS